MWKTQHIKKARKDHKCAYCSFPIKAGTSYYRETGLNDDDDFIDYHIHVECREHAREFSDGDWVFPENRSKCIKFVTVEGTKELKEEMNNNLRIEGYLLDKVIGG